MTSDQKQMIVRLREQGYGYTAIAKAAGLSKGNVRDYCRAHGLTGLRGTPAASLDITPCMNCGKPIIQKPKVKRRKFCSDRCRMDWWSAHRDMLQHNAVYSFICPQCGMQFKSYGYAHRKYCSRQCMADARRKGDVADGC